MISLNPEELVEVCDAIKKEISNALDGYAQNGSPAAFETALNRIDVLNTHAADSMKIIRANEQEAGEESYTPAHQPIINMLYGVNKGALRALSLAQESGDEASVCKITALIFRITSGSNDPYRGIRYKELAGNASNCFQAGSLEQEYLEDIWMWHETCARERSFTLGATGEETVQTAGGEPVTNVLCREILSARTKGSTYTPPVPPFERDYLQAIRDYGSNLGQQRKVAPESGSTHYSALRPYTGPMVNLG